MRRLLGSATLLVALAIAGCGGTWPVQAAARCTPNDVTMQCVLSTQPPLRSVPRTTTGLYGVDFAWGGPRSCGAMRAIGAHFAIGYLSYDPSKNLGPSLSVAFHRCGIPTVVGWETSATRAESGYAAGVADAHAAASQAAADGNTNIWFAIDFDANGPEVLSYFQGVHSVLGARAGAYGGYRPLLYLYQHGVVGHHNFQTYAWSGGAWLPASIAPLEQYLNGSSYDNDRAIAADYGQSGAPKPQKAPDPYATYDKTRRHLGKVRASEYNTVKTWDRAQCRNPAKRTVCKSSWYHMSLLQGRLWNVSAAHGIATFGRSTPSSWTVDHRGARYQGLQHRLNRRRVCTIRSCG